MVTSFEDAWADIRRRLIAGTVVNNWSVNKGYTGGTFHINGVDDAAVIVRRPKRRISKRDFECIFAFWPGYKDRTVPWSKLAEKTFNATYILGILHWREEFQSSAAPAPTNPPASMPSRPDRVSVTKRARHDDYGKRVLREATKGAAVQYGTAVEIDYGVGQPARIDAIVGDIAVEIESRVSKQVRGAVLDLICHPYPKKLLVLLPVHMSNPGVTAEQCRNIMKRFCPDGSFRVIILKGSGDDPRLVEDAVVLAAALADFRIPP